MEYKRWYLLAQNNEYGGLKDEKIYKTIFLVIFNNSLLLIFLYMLNNFEYWGVLFTFIIGLGWISSFSMLVVCVRYTKLPHNTAQCMELGRILPPECITDDNVIDKQEKAEDVVKEAVMNYVLVKAKFCEAAIYSVEYCYEDAMWHGYKEMDGKRELYDNELPPQELYEMIRKGLGGKQSCIYDEIKNNIAPIWIYLKRKLLFQSLKTMYDYTTLGNQKHASLPV